MSSVRHSRKPSHENLCKCTLFFFLTEYWVIWWYRWSHTIVSWHVVWPSDTVTGPALVQIMTCRLLGAKPLSKPMLVYCQLDHWGHISVKFESKYHNIHWRKFLRCCLQHGHHVKPQPQCFNSLRPRQMDAISQTTFSSAFSWMKMFEFQLKFHWSLFPRVRLAIFQHWFR